MTDPKLKREHREPGADRRHAIAQAARELIIEKGFEGLRTRDIAERVGINIATLHYHVPTKEALIGMVAQTLRADFIAQSQRRPRLHLPPLTQLRMEFEDFRETMTDSPEMVVLLSELLDRGRRDDKMAEIILPLHVTWVAILEDILRRGVVDGSLRPDLDPLAAARIFTGAMSDFWRRNPNQPDGFDALTAELERAVVNPATASRISAKD